MKTTALIEMGKNGTYSIFTPDIATMIYGEGATVAEAKIDIEKSYNDIVNYANERGEELPRELRNLEFDYHYDIASLLNHFDFINATRFAKRVAINPSLMRQYKSGSAYISESQLRKIENALHEVAREMLSAKMI